MVLHIGKLTLGFVHANWHAFIPGFHFSGGKFVGCATKHILIQIIWIQYSRKGIGWINALQRFFVMNAGGIFALLWIMTLMETTLLSVLSAGMSIAA